MVHSSDSVAEAHSHQLVAVPSVDQASFKTDTCTTHNGYSPARCYSSDGKKVYDVCMDKARSEEISADTWCSIGTLYQQQKQYVDALQAYMCAVQLDRSHSPAWTDLGVLYETCGQPKDALTCYTNAAKSSGLSASTGERLAGRIRLLQQYLACLPASYWQGRCKTLPSIQEALSLPIPAELTSRHVAISPGASQHRSMVSPSQIHEDVAASLQSTTDAGVSAVKRPRLEEDADRGIPADICRSPSSASDGISSLVNVPNRVLTSGLTDSDLTRFFEAQRTITALSENILAQLGAPPGFLAAADDTKCGKMAAEDDAKVKVKVENDAAVTDSEININTSMTAEQIAVACKGKGRTTSLTLTLRPCTPRRPSGLPLPPLPPLPREKLSPPTPSVYVANKKDALAPQLEQFCLQEPTVVIRGIANAVQLDLGLFSSKSLVEANPDHVIEVRTQKQQPPDENSDGQGVAQWRCESSKSHTSIAKYAQYQAMSYQDAIKEEEDRIKGIVKESDESDSNSSGVKGKKYKMIRFGTNLDLSDERKWKAQLQELRKLPDFTKVVADTNMLNYMGLPILGMNTVQLYMKVPGSRTPGHQENLNYCSVNINIGPGDCEWFCVPHEYWRVIAQLCESNGVHYLKGSWWPDIDDLHRHNVPVYRFIQKPGDLVWVGSGTVHWVQAIGWCNNIAWNVGPMTSLAYDLALDRFEYNKLVGYKSIVPFIQLSWNLARKVKVTDPRLFDLIRHTISLSLQQCFLVLDLLCQLGREVKWHGRTDNEVAHYCNVCEVEVFNLLFVTQQDRKNVVHCGDCALKMSRSLHGFVVLNQYRMDELMDIYDSFTLSPVVDKDSAGL